MPCESATGCTTLLSAGTDDPGAGRRMVAEPAPVMSRSCRVWYFQTSRIGCPAPSVPATVNSMSLRLYQDVIAPVFRSVRFSRLPGPGPCPVSGSVVDQEAPPLMYCDWIASDIFRTAPVAGSSSQSPVGGAGPFGCTAT